MSRPSAHPNAKVRIGFVSLGSAEWPGGRHYFQNLFAAIRSITDQFPAEITFLVSGESSGEDHALFDRYIDQTLPLPPSPLWRRVVLELQRRLNSSVGPEPALLQRLRAGGVDVLFTNRDCGPKRALPVLCWIPDFQHVRMPSMFSAAEVRARSRHARHIATYADRVVLSSASALKDFSDFVPSAVQKARVLSFVAQIPDGVYDTDPARICDTYRLPRRFVYLPNQFWRHKNHLLVVEALRLATATVPHATIVCSGPMVDYRHPEYFQQVMDRVTSAQLQEKFKVLGMVPHGHVLQLMRQSLAVLQPSLFEGWSTSIEEAKSIGKRVVASDIPVHREQKPWGARYFEPHDPEDLANCLVETFSAGEPGPDHELEARARQALPARTRSFGEAFASIVCEVATRAR